MEQVPAHGSDRSLSLPLVLVAVVLFVPLGAGGDQQGLHTPGTCSATELRPQPQESPVLNQSRAKIQSRCGFQGHFAFPKVPRQRNRKVSPCLCCATGTCGNPVLATFFTPPLSLTRIWSCLLVNFSRINLPFHPPSLYTDK